MNMHLVNIRNMYRAVETGQGFDVIIVVSSSQDQADFWQERLEGVRGWVIGRNTRVISEYEDWPGGAGQLLGTLYAWQKARARFDVDDVLARGGRVAMYHTAGKGMRMAPLPAAEANNKSAIKLPRLIEVRGQKTPITVLEAVIFQTGIFATSRPGRLCVFWGDQVFIPSNPVDFDGRHHAEILDIRAEIPKDEETWKRDWQSYGLILPGERGEVLQREKQSWQQLQKFIRDGAVKPNGAGRIVLGKSLGCFSASYPLLEALLEESARELGEKRLKLDTDPHLWMPLTSEMHDFIASGGDISNWKRVNKFKARFLAKSAGGLGLFGDKDVGADTLWWDYGQVRLYHQNFLKLLETSPEGECLREFYDLESFWVKKSRRDGLDIEDSVIVDSCAEGKIKHSILIGVNADSVDISGTVIINSSLAEVKAENALIY
ncbi:MAG: hypothetical protein FJZ95_05075, partial [Chloroflexi bacterium]|nr:hypothetical protein [Chloroflexota bacterium]